MSAAAIDVRLLRRGLRLEYATLGWNAVGCVVLAATATATGSVALAGFGVDSAIEIVASAVVVWQLKARSVTAASGSRCARSRSRSHCSSSTSPLSPFARSCPTHTPARRPSASTGSSSP
jgi:hypothetical protein